MKKQLLSILITIVSFNCFAQITLDKGYYINNDNQRVECLIKNNDRVNNPTSFQYKLNENSELKTLTIKDVKEFGVYNFSKYLKRNVNIDRSGDNTNDLSSDRNVKLKNEELFLKVLVDGDATLYSYIDGNLTRFFYKKKNSKIEQLNYKRYFVTPTQVGKNNRYQQQLWNDLKCEKISMKDIEKLNYKVSKLITLFIKYNKCSDTGFVNTERKDEKGAVNLSLVAGFMNSDLSLKHPTAGIRNSEISGNIGFRVGFEVEYVLAFNRNKWALVVQPNYQSFKAEESVSGFVGASPLLTTVKAEYNALEIPMGIRHYLYLNKNSKIFINGFLSIDAGGKLNVDYSSTALDPEYKIALTNAIYGIGYKYQNKYSLELRYQTNSSGDFDRSFLAFKNNMLSLIFAYKIF